MISNKLAILFTLGGAAAISAALASFDKPKPKPPAISIIEKIKQEQPLYVPIPRVVKTESIIPPFAERWAPKPVVEEPTVVPIQPPPKLKPIDWDVCSKHGMRKVWYGKRWRCRR